MRSAERPDGLGVILAAMDSTEFDTRNPASESLRVALETMPDHLRPVSIVQKGTAMYRVSGDTWAPTICELLHASHRTIKVAAYSISTRWPTGVRGLYAVLPAMKAAAASGVRCEALLARTRKAGQVKTWNAYAAVQLTQAGWRVRFVPPSRLLHAKLWIFDTAAYMIGSHNTAQAAAAENTELSCLLLSSSQLAAIDSWWIEQWKAGVQ